MFYFVCFIFNQFLSRDNASSFLPSFPYIYIYIYRCCCQSCHACPCYVLSASIPHHFLSRAPRLSYFFSFERKRTARQIHRQPRMQPLRQVLAGKRTLQTALIVSTRLYLRDASKMALMETLSIKKRHKTTITNNNKNNNNVLYARLHERTGDWNETSGVGF